MRRLVNTGLTRCPPTKSVLFSCSPLVCSICAICVVRAYNYGKDGGGVRGISSLEILAEIMSKVRGVDIEEAKKMRPCEYFDMMCGTSTGG